MILTYPKSQGFTANQGFLIYLDSYLTAIILCRSSSWRTLSSSSRLFSSSSSFCRSSSLCWAAMSTEEGAGEPKENGGNV